MLKYTYSPLKVNLGCGLNVVNGWVNIDGNLSVLLSKFPKILKKTFYLLSNSKDLYSADEYISILENNIFVHHNVNYGLPFRGRSVDYIYTSHFLEHLFKDDVEKLLYEACRILKTDGIIRICVPDLEYIIKLYLEGNKERALEYFFRGNKNLSYFNSHKYLYDFELLKSILSKVGFTYIEKWSFQKGNVPDIDKLDNRPKETLFIEAKKL